jgi:hypothetical protein
MSVLIKSIYTSQSNYERVSLDPKRYLKDTCEWLCGSLGRIRNKKEEGIYFASSYEKRLRKASARASESLGLKDPMVYMHVIHWVMTDCGMRYDARLLDKDGTDHSTIDMRRFDSCLLEKNIEKYNRPWKEGDTGHIDARYRAAWEDENPGRPLPGTEPVPELLPEEPALIERIMLFPREETVEAEATA